MPITAAELDGEFAQTPERGRLQKEFVVITGSTGAAGDSVSYTSKRFGKVIGALGIGYNTINGATLNLVAGEALGNNQKIITLLGTQ